MSGNLPAHVRADRALRRRQEMFLRSADVALPCQHPDDGLTNAQPAVKIDGHVTRWAFDCPCGEIVVLDAGDGGDLPRHGNDESSVMAPNMEASDG